MYFILDYWDFIMKYSFIILVLAFFTLGNGLFAFENTIFYYNKINGGFTKRIFFHYEFNTEDSTKYVKKLHWTEYFNSKGYKVLLEQNKNIHSQDECINYLYNIDFTINKVERFYNKSEYYNSSTYFYNDKGQIFYIAYDFNDNGKLSNDFIFYDSLNNPINQIFYNYDNTIGRIKKYVYNKKNKFSEYYEYDINDILLGFKIFKYFEDNTMELVDNNLIEKKITTTKYKFNEHNNIIEEREYDINGNIQLKTIYNYDEYNNPKNIYDYNSKNQLTNKWEYIYFK